MVDQRKGGTAATHEGAPSQRQFHYSPRRPRPGTIKASILDYLLQGGTLTAAQAMQMYHTMRLAVFIDQLKQDGWPIRSERLPVVTADGRRVSVARYRIENEGPQDEVL